MPALPVPARSLRTAPGRLVPTLLALACHPGGATGDETSTTITSAASASDGVHAASSDDTTAADDGATSDAGDTSGGPEEPPPPGCEDQPQATDDLGTTPGEVSLPSPTLEHLTVLWLVDGDSDDDASVSVRWREQGGTWHAGVPLRHAPAGSLEGFDWPNRFAGTVFGLEPGTDYDVELYLTDPDGGCELRTLQASTRPIPAAMPGAPTMAVTPASFDDAVGSASPGDVLELAAGTYPGFTFERDGTADAPIVLRAVGAAVIDGDIRLDGRSYVMLEGLEVHGRIAVNEARGLAIVRNHVLTSGDGIVAQSRAEDLYIADNVVEGATVWAPGSLGVDGDNVGEGIVVTGPGHVIEHNAVRGFRDAISLMEESEAVDQWSIDILRNDIAVAADDGVEADFCFHDCRVIGNRMTNVFMGISSQPGLGGPTWFVRNVIHNAAYQAFKLQRGSIGDVALHNTVIKMGDALSTYTEDVFSRQYFRNNLMLGGPGASYGGYDNGEGDVIDLRAITDADLDYDGYGSTAGMFTGHYGDVAFADLAELRAMTTEAHAIEVDLSVFAASVAIPTAAFPELEPVDVRLAPGSAAIDAGIAIPGIDHAGTAPDLGAIELGEPPPSYGPRP